MDGRIDKSLSEIIRSRDNLDRRLSSGSTSLRATSFRHSRHETPYDNSRRNENGNTHCAIKFLVDNNLGGSFIGNNGDSIRDIIEITNADIYLSPAHECYPGTKLRVIYMAGTWKSIALGQALVWEMIGQQTKSRIDGSDLVWNPAMAKASPGEYDDVMVQGTITIPAAQVGAIIGPSFSILNELRDRCNVKAEVSSIQAAEVENTKERTIHIAGSVASCMNFTSMVLSKLMEYPDGLLYFYNGTRYARGISSLQPGGLGAHGGGGGGGVATSVGMGYSSHSATSGGGGGGGRGGMGREVTVSGSISSSTGSTYPSTSLPLRNTTMGGGSVAGTIGISSNSFIELNVPDRHIGAVMGKQRLTLQNVQLLTGANIVVSERHEMDKSEMRLVRISGTPADTQVAQTLLLHLLKKHVEYTQEETRFHI
eukprot:CAMPEP_0175011578 /NCGR_PEP_ID=MMETSP0005-20121125/8772_1 /TAXON_ID=420556 /ORGANISM="Ochromonas sp., Strain CCMP1393" /LENGTH=424 /DNA_ID=CAMNT_0016267601 /DNA_START=41 /DNA_END=1315 /DNA_ORIENTATION=+